MKNDCFNCNWKWNVDPNHVISELKFDLSIPSFVWSTRIVKVRKTWDSSPRKVSTLQDFHTMLGYLVIERGVIYNTHYYCTVQIEEKKYFLIRNLVYPCNENFIACLSNTVPGLLFVLVFIFVTSHSDIVEQLVI